MQRDDGVWVTKGGRREFGKIARRLPTTPEPSIQTYDVWVDGQLQHNVPETDLEPCPLCPECGEEPARNGGRGSYCRGRSMRP